jgi:ubiquitin carboxyl-terminal hydrolase 8
MGSIADRMKALSGKGMDVGANVPERRTAKETGVSHPPVSAGLSRMGAIHETGPGHSNSRTQRSRSNSQVDGHEGQKPSPTGSGSGSGSRSRSSSIKENRPPINITPLPAHEEHTSPHASSSRAPPVIAPKPKLPIPPTQTHTQPIQPSGTGASTSSTRVNIGETPNTPRTESIPIAPSHSGPAPQSAKSSKPPLPPIPQAQHTGHNPKPGPGPETNGLSDFEKTFPSLDEFGKQFADVPPFTLKTNETSEHKEEEENKYSFPDVPSGSFPNLPSVPSSRPGMATPPHGSPPSGFAGLRPPHANGNGNGTGHDSPPLPDTDRETKRPTSQPNLTKLDGRVDPSIADGVTSPTHPAPTLQDFRTPLQPTPNPMSPQSTTSPNGHSPQPQPIAFPTPQPTPASATRRPMPIPPSQQVTPIAKPKFPFSNSVNCETLRSYFLNPDVEMILLDVRPEEEYRRGVVGAEYEPRGAKLRVIWMDPTVLMRSE